MSTTVCAKNAATPSPSASAGRARARARHAPQSAPRRGAEVEQEADDPGLAQELERRVVRLVGVDRASCAACWFGELERARAGAAARMRA